jgi:rubredoxin
MSTKQKWICALCDHVYDPAVGDPDSGLPPGTPFEAIPDDWYCPVCGARKSDFTPLE